MIILNNVISTMERNNDYGLYPDLFKSEKEKNKPSFIKDLVDYFYMEALKQYTYNCRTWANNYRFVKGQLLPQDFYENQDVLAFSLELTDDVPLPEYVQMYSILNQPINTMAGEQSAKPDNSRVKAFDDDSRSEELQFRTEILNQFITAQVQTKMAGIAAQQGIDLQTEEGLQQYQAMTQEELSTLLTSFTTQGEKWGNHILNALKMEFNLKELGEEAFRDLLISGRERFHIMEDMSKLGFKLECVNPKNTWKMSSPDKKYYKDAYAAGLIEVMEISEIIEKFPITKEEIDHLRDQLNRYYNTGSYPTSNLFNDKTGIDSITYNKFDPLLLEQRLMLESNILKDPIQEDLANISEFGMLGQKFIVLQAYVLGKKRVGKLTYIDEDGNEQTTLVDENYKNNQHPEQIDLEWAYVNQWYKYLKIGSDIYYAAPFELLDYCPIIGADFENRNSEVKSMIDQMKPYQMIFNVSMNQLWEMLQKEKGPLVEFHWRKIPVNKDSSYEDALDEWLTQARELGFIFNDDSPENMQAPSSNTNTTKILDLSLTANMQSRLAICEAIKRECHSLVGITPERLGGVAATQTATGTQAALSSSYSQTQPYFTQHEYTMNQVKQAILDAAQYIESEKPVSTISYITNEGESAFIQVLGSDLKLRDLRCYVTDNTKDQRIFEQLQALAQPMLQNGADLVTVSELWITDSIRQIRDIFRKDKEKRDQQIAQAQQLEQQKIQSQQEAVQAQIQAQQQDKQEARYFEANQNELDRLNKKEIALLQAAGRDNTVLNDNDGNGIADALEVSKQALAVDQANKTFEMQQQKLQSDIAQQQQKIQANKQQQLIDDKRYQEELALKKRKLDIEEEKNKVAIQNKVVGEK